ncbi:MAG: hypothetical protein ACTSVI_09130 [Promethearchaeota archaeon]
MKKEDDINNLITQLEEAEFYGDYELMKYLSRVIYRSLRSKAEKLMRSSNQFIEASEYFISSSEFIQRYDFFDAVIVLEKSIEMLKIAANNARINGNFKQAGDHYKMVARIFRQYFNNLISAKEYCKKAIECFEEDLRIKKQLGNFMLNNEHFNLAELNFMISNWKETEYHARKTIKYSLQQERYHAVANAYGLLLNVFLHKNDEDMVVRTFIETRELFESVISKITKESKKKNYLKIADVYHTFASFYDILRDVDKFRKISVKEASSYLNAAKEYDDQEDYLTSALYYHSAGLVLMKIGNFKNAFAAFLEAARKYGLLENAEEAAVNYLKASECMELAGEFISAVKMIMSAVEILERIEDYDSIISYLYYALDIVQYIYNKEDKAELHSLLFNKIVDVMQLQTEHAEPREAAYYQLDCAYLLFFNDRKEDSFRCLKKALDYFKVSYCVKEELFVASCIDIIGIIFILDIFKDYSDINFYLDFLKNESSKAPIGKTCYKTALRIIDKTEPPNIKINALSKESYLLNITSMKNLFIIWTEVYNI